MTISVVSFIFEIRKKKMTLVLPLSVLQFHYKKSGSLVAAQLRISIILNYDERREKSVGFPCTFLDLTISLLTPYETLTHALCRA